MAKYVHGVVRRAADVVSVPEIITPSLPDAQEGVAYSQFVQVNGGEGALVFSVSAGTLPTWASLNAGTGEVSGTPADEEAEAAFTVKVADENLNEDTQAYAITTLAASTLNITTLSLPAATVGVPYSEFVAATGGTPPYTYAVSSGALPSWASLTAATGEISGEPTATEALASFAITATDDVAATSDPRALSIATNAPDALRVLTSALPNAEVGTPYSAVLVAENGVEPYEWSIDSGELPTGFALNASTGEISHASPTVVEVQGFTVRVEDDLEDEAFRGLSITVVAEGTLEGPHDFFETNAARDEVWLSRTLRSQAQLNESTGGDLSTVYTYDFANDTYHDKQDAAKLLWGPAGAGGSIPANQQLKRGPFFKWDTNAEHFPEGTRLLIILDYYHGIELLNMGEFVGGTFQGISTWKHFNLQEGAADFGALWIEPQLEFRDRDPADPTMIARYATRVYQGLNRGTWSPFNKCPVGVTNCGNNPNPTGVGALAQRTWPIYGGVWVRFWIEVRHGLPGTSEVFDSWKSLPVYQAASSADKTAFEGETWSAVSIWGADENRDPVRLMYKYPHWADRAPDGIFNIQSFRWEHNTSSSNTLLGDVVGYTRNAVFLRNFPSSNMVTDLDEGDTTLFRKPVR